MAGTQPLAWNFTSAMRPSVSFAVSLRMSPQAGFSTWAEASGESTTPALRGCPKWSRTWREYTLTFYSTTAKPFTTEYAERAEGK